MMTPDQLKAAILAKFPANATSWKDATDDVRFLSRAAREELGLDEEFALNFRALATPARWNERGAQSAADFYARMNPAQRRSYLARIEGIL